MLHRVDIHAVQRANTVLLLSMVWAGLAACAIAALAYDISHWLAD
jgi:hypothetical protein